jgi:hypothetical protein
MADLTKIYFGDSHPKYDVITADVQAHVLEKNCQALVLNPDMSERDLFWSYTDRDRSKIKVIPGEGGSGHALRVYDRDSSWRGLMQHLDPRCIVAGEEFLITANFRLTNSTGHGVECDPNIQWNNNEGSQCPSVVVYGKECPTGKNVYWQFWNSKSVRTKSMFRMFSSCFRGTLTQFFTCCCSFRTKHGILTVGTVTKLSLKSMKSLLHARKFKCTFTKLIKTGISTLHMCK